MCLLRSAQFIENIILTRSYTNISFEKLLNFFSLLLFRRCFVCVSRLTFFSVAVNATIAVVSRSWKFILLFISTAYAFAHKLYLFSRSSLRLYFVQLPCLLFKSFWMFPMNVRHFRLALRKVIASFFFGWFFFLYIFMWWQWHKLSRKHGNHVLAPKPEFEKRTGTRQRWCRNIFSMGMKIVFVF